MLTAMVCDCSSVQHAVGTEESVGTEIVPREGIAIVALHCDTALWALHYDCDTRL